MTDKVVGIRPTIQHRDPTVTSLIDNFARHLEAFSQVEGDPTPAPCVAAVWVLMDADGDCQIAWNSEATSVHPSFILSRAVAAINSEITSREKG
jgi:hypothetical protein